MPREVTTHLITDLPGVAELLVYAGQLDQFDIPHLYEFREEVETDQTPLDKQPPAILALELQSGDPRNGWNGVTTLSVLAALRDFLECCQASRFACPENAIAIKGIEQAICSLVVRVRRRVAEQTMHTHQAGAGETPTGHAVLTKSNGRVAYEGYFAKCGGKSLISGAPLPSFDAQKPEIQEAWEAAAAAVLA